MPQTDGQLEVPYTLPVGDMLPEAEIQAPEELSPDQARLLVFINDDPQLAGIRLEAHGGKYSLEDAVKACPEAMAMLVSLEQNLRNVPNGKEILTNTILSTASALATRANSRPGAVKKKS